MKNDLVLLKKFDCECFQLIFFGEKNLFNVNKLFFSQR